MKARSISPKALAQAIGVSESSLKRWTDGGLLTAVRTPGGHRRIPVAEAVRFIRATGTPVLRPDLLGLGELPIETTVGEDLTTQVIGALLADEAAAAGQLMMAAFLGGLDVAELCDGPMREAMAYVGDLWLHRADGVLIEHRATDVCVGLLATIRSLLPERPPSAVTATGGGASGDPYFLPSLMADTVLGDAGFHTYHLGADTPIETQRLAAERFDARLVWRSYSVPVEPEQVLADFAVLEPVLQARDGHFVVGGRGLPPGLPRRRRLHVVQSMVALADVGGWLSVSTGRQGNQPA